MNFEENFVQSIFIFQLCYYSFACILKNSSLSNYLCLEFNNEQTSLQIKEQSNVSSYSGDLGLILKTLKFFISHIFCINWIWKNYFIIESSLYLVIIFSMGLFNSRESSSRPTWCSTFFRWASCPLKIIWSCCSSRQKILLWNVLRV